MSLSHQCSCGETIQIDEATGRLPGFCHRCGARIAASPPPLTSAPPPPPPPRAASRGGNLPPPPPPRRGAFTPPPQRAASTHPFTPAGVSGLMAVPREMLGAMVNPDASFPRLLQQTGFPVPGALVAIYIAAALTMTALSGITSFKILLVIFTALAVQVVVMTALVFAGGLISGPRDRIGFVTACNAVCTVLIPLTMAFVIGGLLSKVAVFLGSAIFGYLSLMAVFHLITSLRFMGLTARGSIHTAAVTMIVGGIVLGIVIAMMADTLAGGMMDSAMGSSDMWSLSPSDQEAFERAFNSNW